MRAFLLTVIAATACGGPQAQLEIGPPPARATRGALAGPLCTTEGPIAGCQCRISPDDAGLPEDASRKRYEIRIASANELWVTLPTHALYKSPERAETCFYVDLAPGAHQLALRASNPDGISVQLKVRELGTATRSWYDTFTFGCGAPGVCTFAELDTKRAEYGTLPRNLHDACGSTKITGITWDTGKAPDQLHPSELVLRATLDIYKFAPSKEHGDPSCGRP